MIQDYAIVIGRIPSLDNTCKFYQASVLNHCIKDFNITDNQEQNTIIMLKYVLQYSYIVLIHELTIRTLHNY